MDVTKAAAASHTTTRAMEKAANSTPKTTASKKAAIYLPTKNPQPAVSSIRRHHKDEGQNDHPPKQQPQKE